jgi:hypothetical protein
MDFDLVVLTVLGARLQFSCEQALADRNLTDEARAVAQEGLNLALELRELVTNPDGIDSNKGEHLAKKFDALGDRTMGAEVTLV